MIREFVGWGLVVLLVAAVVLSFYYMWKDSEEVHGRLDDFENKAKNALTKQELTSIAQELCDFANKRCFHRHYGSHARRVLAYIQGKRECITN